MSARKCKIFNMDEEGWEDCQAEALITEDLSTIEEGAIVDADGVELRGDNNLQCANWGA